VSPFVLLFLSFMLVSCGAALCPYTTLFRSLDSARGTAGGSGARRGHRPGTEQRPRWQGVFSRLPFHDARGRGGRDDLASGREQRSEEHTSELSHVKISYAVFCLKKKKSPLQ